MSLHKLTAGDGYTYLTRQVAAADATSRGRGSLADYYSAKGEAPGQWCGDGLASLTIAGADASKVSGTVTEEQMEALFGAGRHPNHTALYEEVWWSQPEEADAQARASAAGAAVKLGREFNTATEATELQKALAIAFRDHNLTAGKPAGDPIDPEVRDRIRTDVAVETFTATYRRPPADDRELAGYIAQNNRHARRLPVAGYDMTFSPVKSVSALWAIAPRDVAAIIEEAHTAAVADALAFMQEHAAFTRLGTDGVRQVDTSGYIAAAFTHRDSRAGDPDLHTHVAVSNKVLAITGAGERKWVALDGRMIFKATVSASERYNSRLEAHLSQRLGVDFAERPTKDRSKRPVREIVGVPATVIERWSMRREAIERRASELAQQFWIDHGREPTTTELLDLHQRATLETREAKHEPRSLAEQRAEWRSQAREVLGSEQAVAAMITDALHHDVRLRRKDLSKAELDHYAGQIIATVSASRARWHTHHLRAEAERLLRNPVDISSPTDPDAALRRRLGQPVGYASGRRLAPELMDSAVAAVVARALTHTDSIVLTNPRLDGDLAEPAALRRQDGSSVYTVHETAMYSSRDIVDAEARILASACRIDGRRTSGGDVDIALLETEANGRSLNAGQRELVRRCATSGRRVQLVLAPAGTGKTTAMRTLCSAWNGSGGTVIGLAPTAAAAAVLREELDTDTDTLAKLVDIVTHQKRRAELESLAATPRRRTLLDRDLAKAVKAARQALVTEPERRLPDWFTRIGEGTLVVVDEAGMAATGDLDILVDHVLSQGGSIRLVGDDQQLASISAGGVLRDIAHETDAITLSQVVRFSDPAEGAASLALRDGDPAALGYYADQHRIHVTADTAAADCAYDAWKADRDGGHDAVLLAPTRDTVNALNARARRDRLAQDPACAADRALPLADGLLGSRGDIIATRRNDRRLRTSATDWVRNGDRWTVLDVTADGGLWVSHLETKARLLLPAGYVRDHVTLGYASTVHAAQGLTADVCHVVASDALSRQLSYVALTRGRHGNHVYLGTGVGDPHAVTTPRATTPITAAELLESVLAKDGAQRSATSTARDHLDPFTRVPAAVAAYRDAVDQAAETLAGDAELAALAAMADTVAPGVTDAGAWPVLRAHLARISANNGDPKAALEAAATGRELGSADDIAAVLDWRLDSSGRHGRSEGPLPWTPAIPALLRHDDTWGDYLRRRAERVSELVADITGQVHQWTPRTAPNWARPYLDDRSLCTDLALWRAVNQVDDRDRRPAGPDHPERPLRAHQMRLRQRAVAVADDMAAAAARWYPLIAEIDPAIAADPYWPLLADDLAAARRAGVDVHSLVRAAAAEGPLPTELPASALWWRLSRDLDATALNADSSTAALTPTWIDAVASSLGADRAALVIADPAWPSLVAAVDAADHDRNTPADLIANAASLLEAGGDGDHVRTDEYARALAWRIDLLNHHAGDPQIVYEDTTAPPDPDDEEAHAAHVEDPHNPYSGTPADAADVLAAADAAYFAEVLPATEYSDKNPSPAGVDDVDEDYLAALLAGPAPVDPGDGPIPDDDGYDRYDGDFDDLPTTRPPAQPTPAPMPVRDVADLIADRYEWGALAAEIRAELATARAQFFDVARPGPHEQAAAPEISRMRAIAEAQRPARADMLTCHEEWIAADLAAELAENAAANPDLPDDERPGFSAVAVSARAALDVARTALDDARAAHLQVVADTGGTPITSTDIEHVRLAALELDHQVVVDLREQLQRIEHRIFRIDNALAHRHALTRAAIATHLVTYPATEAPLDQEAPEPSPAAGVDLHTSAAEPAAVAGIEIEPVPALDAAPEQTAEERTAEERTGMSLPPEEQLPAAVAAPDEQPGEVTDAPVDVDQQRREQVRSDPARRRHRDDLLRVRANAVKTIGVDDNTQIVRVQPRHVHDVEAVQEALRQTAERIRAARAARAAYKDANAAATRAQATYDHLSASTPQDRAQHQRQQQLAEADAIMKMRQRHATELRLEAQAARAAVGAPFGQWDQILAEAADEPALDAALAAAKERDAQVLAPFRDSADKAAKARRVLADIDAELARRDGLPPDELAAEDAHRDPPRSQKSAATRPTPVRTSTVPQQNIDRRIDRDYGL